MPEISTEVLPETAISDVNSQPEMASVVSNVSEKPFSAEDSPLKATLDQHKRIAKKGARKKGESAGDDPATGMSSAIVERPKPLPVPSARHTVFKKEATNPAQDSKKFYTYWNELPGWAKDMTVCYVYRDWPKLIDLAEDSKEFVYIDKVSGNEPLQDDVDLMNMYGAGSYKLMFNDQTPGHNRNICTVYVPSMGLADMKSHPPVDRRISDTAQVDMDFPGNKSYIEFLRMTGKLPEQIKGKEVELEMANIQLVDKLLERGDAAQASALKIAEKAIEKGREKAEVGEDAVNRAINIVAAGAERANKMVTDAAELTKVNQKSDVSSVKETLDLVGTIIEKFTPQSSGDSAEVIALRAEVSRLRDDRFKSLEEQITLLRSTPTVVPHTSSPKETMKESISAFKEMRDLVEEVSGGSDKKNPIAEVGDELGLPKWAQMGIQYGLPLLSNVVQMVMVGRGMIPAPTPPMPGMPGAPGMGGGAAQQPMQQARPMPQQQPQPMAPNPSGVSLPAPVPPTLDPNARTASGLPTFGIHPDIAELLWEIKTPVVQYVMSVELDGQDYAAAFCDNYGIDSYNMIKSFGVDGVEMAIGSFPPITTKLQALNVTQEKFHKFVEEFVNADLVQGDSESESESDETVTPKGDNNGKPTA